MRITTLTCGFFFSLAAMCFPAAGFGLCSDNVPINPGGLPGTLIIVGGGSVPDEVPAVLKASLKENKEAAVVVLTDAASDTEKAADSAKTWLGEHEISNVTAIDSSLPKTERQAQTLVAICAADAVWITGGQQSVLAEAFAGSSIDTALQNLLNRGGTIGGTSAGAAIMSKIMIVSGKDQPEIANGWDLLPGAIVDQHFTERTRLPRSLIAIEKHPEQFGLGIDEGTAIFVAGRQMHVMGNGSATVILAKTSYRDREVTRLVSGDSADLTQLRRAARQRASGIDPGEPQFGASTVPNGSLVIVGGGAMPQDVADRFVELAGGSKARIVVLPTAVPPAQTSREVPGFLRRKDIEDVTVLTQRGTEVAADEFRSALKAATGIWFGGGRQWNFVDAYEGTEAVELFHDVLRRGGVIGGSSAGATIQGEFLVRGHPLGNTVMMAEGYERGFSFLPGAAIDQHFTQRGRQPDLLPVIRRHPKLLGIGIDEGTAIVMTGSTAQVIGQHSAHFVTAKQLGSIPLDEPLPQQAEDAAKFYISVKNGEEIDLSGLFELP